jgi:hypothetical protein
MLVRCRDGLFECDDGLHFRRRDGESCRRFVLSSGNAGRQEGAMPEERAMPEAIKRM